MFRAYFDESRRDAGEAPIFGIAGYLISTTRFPKFCSEWNRHLRKAKVQAFHAKDFAHSRGAFKEMPEAKRRTLLQRLTDTIRDRTEAGFVVLMSPAEYETLTTAEWRQTNGNAYTFVARFCLEVVRDWAETNSFKGKIHYNFASGGGPGAGWGAHLDRIATRDEWKGKYRYGSHGFADANIIAPLQAADLLAYEATKFYTDTHSKPKGSKREPRFGFQRLIGDPSAQCSVIWLRAYPLRCGIEMVRMWDQEKELRKWLHQLRLSLASASSSSPSPSSEPE